MLFSIVIKLPKHYINVGAYCPYGYYKYEMECVIKCPEKYYIS